MSCVNVESNIDFFIELKKELDKVKNDEEVDKMDEAYCLLTKQPLEDNSIILECAHVFNYIPLYREVVCQKNNNPLEVTYLNINEIKCPYCRTKSIGLLPYIPIYDLPVKRGVNYPDKYCKKIHACEWKFKSGRKRGNYCSKSAYKHSGYTYCCQHHSIQHRANLDTLIKIKSPLLKIEWTDEHNSLYKKYKVVQLKEILKNHKFKISGTKKELIERIVLYKLLE